MGQPTLRTENEAFIPVIVGVAQLLDRPLQNQNGFEPFILIKKALELANDDALGQILQYTDSIHLVNVTSWSYDNLVKMIIDSLNLSPRYFQEGDVSGDSPIRFLCESAERIAKGESVVSVVCGGESSWSVSNAIKLQKDLTDWTPQIPQKFDNTILVELGLKYGLYNAVNIYALFENACRSLWGQNFQDAQYESSVIWATFSKVAEECEAAWTRKRLSPDEIMTPTKDNRIIAWPYTKKMIANNTVNGATAIIMTNLAFARSMGISEDKIIYIGAGAHANEPKNYLQRESFDRSIAMEVVLNKVLSANNLHSDQVELAEIYSCFPCVVKLARRILGWGPEHDMTVIGGMNSGGAQLSNFMSQAAVTMVRRLRQQGKNGLLLGNGHFLTHAYATIISKEKPVCDGLMYNMDCQNEADVLRGKIPELLDRYEGSAKIDTYTVVFDREGLPDFAIIVAKTRDNKRVLARIDKTRSNDLARLMNKDYEPIGMVGHIVVQDGFNEWFW